MIPTLSPRTQVIPVLLALVLGVGCGDGEEKVASKTEPKGKATQTVEPKADGTPNAEPKGEANATEPPKETPEKFITDPIVEKAIRKELKKPTGELIKVDYEKVTELDIDDKQLTSVKGLEKLTQLESLHLPHNKLTDLKGLGLGGNVLGIGRASAQGLTTVNLQLGWLASNGILGELAASEQGFFEEEGLALEVTPGGPNVDGVASVASGRASIGSISSSPSLMLARSQGLPVKCIAAGYQQHPFTYFSLEKNPVREPQDLVGKTVATNGTARILLQALLAANDIPESEVEVLVMGSDMAPLLTGQADVVTGWKTNTSALEVLGPDRLLFSADYPFESMTDAAVWFDNTPISDAEKKQIGRDNAIKLFKLDLE